MASEKNDAAVNRAMDEGYADKLMVIMTEMLSKGYTAEEIAAIVGLIGTMVLSTAEDMGITVDGEMVGQMRSPNGTVAKA